jgi:hypothetical protein
VKQLFSAPARNKPFRLPLASRQQPHLQLLQTNFFKILFYKITFYFGIVLSNSDKIFSYLPEIMLAGCQQQHQDSYYSL